MLLLLILSFLQISVRGLQTQRQVGTLQTLFPHFSLLSEHTLE